MQPSNGKEILMRDDDYIVSKTDPKGKITYCNRVFMDIAGYREAELLHQPHNIIRHPDMPRSVFRLMWQTLQQGQEFFGIIKNRAKNGDFYWAFANVTPSYDADNQLLGYYSVRRCPSRDSVAAMDALYRQMMQAEQQTESAKSSMDAGQSVLDRFVDNSGRSYGELVLSFEK